MSFNWLSRGWISDARLVFFSSSVACSPSTLELAFYAIEFSLKSRQLCCHITKLYSRFLKASSRFEVPLQGRHATGICPGTALSNWARRETVPTLRSRMHPGPDGPDWSSLLCVHAAQTPSGKLFMVGVWEKIGDNCIVSCGSSFYFIFLKSIYVHLGVQNPM